MPVCSLGILGDATWEWAAQVGPTRLSKESCTTDQVRRTWIEVFPSALHVLTRSLFPAPLGGGIKYTSPFHR